MSAGRRSETGTGLLSTSIGVFIFLVLLLLAVQVTFALYARSAVTAGAYDAARIAAGAAAPAAPSVAGGEGGPAGRAAAEAHLRQVLGRYGDRLQVTWGDDPDAVVLTVRADNPSLVPAALRRPLGLDRVERTVRVRIERELPG